MIKYIAFLRGVNISGKNKIEMSSLKSEFENNGFQEVSTYLNSGNVSFSTDDESPREKIEEIIYNKFNLRIPVYVIETDVLSEILTNAPTWWDTEDKDKYHNLIFILSSDTPEEIFGRIGQPSEELERIQIYKNVIFWTFDRKFYQKCNWWKRTALSGIADRLTIRTANTVKKVCKF